VHRRDQFLAGARTAGLAIARLLDDGIDSERFFGKELLTL